MKISFSEEAFKDYEYWQKQDRKTLKRINELIKDCVRNPFDGIGKAEPLKGDLSGFWSRRIDQEHRLVYTIEEDEIIIVVCRYHYTKWFLSTCDNVKTSVHWQKNKTNIIKAFKYFVNNIQINH